MARRGSVLFAAAGSGAACPRLKGMLLGPLTNALGRRSRTHPGAFPPARRIPEVAAGLPPDLSAVQPVIEPAPGEGWVLKMHTVSATASGAASHRAFYTAAGRTASLYLHTVAARDAERSVEDDETRLGREVRMFGLLARQAARQAPPARRARVPAAAVVTGDWSQASLSVDGAPIPIRSAPVGDRGWIGWWASGDQIIEVQSDAVPASELALT